MKNRPYGIRWSAPVLLAFVLSMTPTSVLAQAPAGDVVAEFTLTNGKVRTAAIVGFGAGNSYAPHAMRVLVDGIPSTVSLARLRDITDITATGATIRYQNGKKEKVAFPEPGRGDEYTFFATAETGTAERYLVGNLKSVTIQLPRRVDREGNAMFRHWRYSPFTGEQLPDPKNEK
jgi:hypothetical protein